jgi:hypothetical protein
MSDIDKLTYKIRQCIDYQSLYALEEEFNNFGLTIQTTAQNRVILCKLRNGKAKADKVIDDYIFVGSLEKSADEISDRAAQKIVDFVQNAKGNKGKLKNVARVWRDGLRMYESTISIMHEDVQCVADNLIID